MRIVQQGFRGIEAAFGQWVRSLRVNLTYTQARLAELVAVRGINLDASAISRIEAGKRSVSLTDAVVIADALGVDLLPAEIRNALRSGVAEARRLEDEMAATQDELRNAQLNRDLMEMRVQEARAKIQTIEGLLADIRKTRRIAEADGKALLAAGLTISERELQAEREDHAAILETIDDDGERQAP